MRGAADSPQRAAWVGTGTGAGARWDEAAKRSFTEVPESGDEAGGRVNWGDVLLNRNYLNQFKQS